MTPSAATSPPGASPEGSPAAALGEDQRALPRLSLLGIALRVLLIVAGAEVWTERSAPQDEFSLFENSILRACLLAQLVAWWDARHALRAALPNFTRRHALALGTILVAAAVLRWSVEPLPWHAFNWLESLYSRTEPEPIPFWYANGFGVFFRVPLSLGLDFESAVFNGNRLLGTLGTLSVFGAVALLSADLRDALWAALAMAVLPLHALLSASETMQLLPAFLVCVALAGFALHARTGDRSGALAGVTALVYACLSRPEAAACGPFLVAAYSVPGGRRRLVDPVLLGLGVVAGAAGIPLYLDGAQQKIGPGLEVVPPREAVINFSRAVASAGPPLITLIALALVGLLVLLARRRLPLVFLCAGALTLLVWLAGFDRNYANRWQLLCAQLPFWCMLAGATLGGAHSLLARVARADAASGLWVVALCAVLGAVGARRSALFHLDFDQQDEYRFVHRALPRVLATRPHALVRPTPRTEGPLAVFPSYAVPQPVEVVALDAFLAGPAPTEAEPTVYYRGLSCYRDSNIIVFPGAMWETCLAIERRYRLEPIVTEVVRSPLFIDVGQPGADAVEIGFFRVLPRAPSPAR